LGVQKARQVKPVVFVLYHCMLAVSGLLKIAGLLNECTSFS